VIDYFTKILEDNLKAVVKPQYVDQIPRAVKGPIQQVQQLISARAALGNEEDIMEVLGAFPYSNISEFSC
jgi:Predicted ATPase, RNase L inhibitor (RLI) homolog